MVTVETAVVPVPDPPGVLRASTQDPTERSAMDADTLWVSAVEAEIVTFESAFADCTEIVEPSTPVISPVTPGKPRPCPCPCCPWPCCCAALPEAPDAAEHAVRVRAATITTAAETAS